jgi:hypothetical protein
LKVLQVFLYCICLESSKFSTQDNVPIHFEGDGRIIIARQIPKPYRSKGQLPLSVLSRHTCAHSENDSSVCKLETVKSSFLRA